MVGGNTGTPFDGEVTEGDLQDGIFGRRSGVIGIKYEHTRDMGKFNMHSTVIRIAIWHLNAFQDMP
jgi:hypothetical protein